MAEVVLGSRLTVDRVTVIADGVIGAIARIELPTAAGRGRRVDLLLLREAHGRWLIDQELVGIDLE